MFEGFIVDSLPLSWPRYTLLFVSRLFLLGAIRHVLQVTKQPRRNLLLSDSVAWGCFFGYAYLWHTLCFANAYSVYDARVMFHCWILCNVMWYTHRRALYARLLSRNAIIAAGVCIYLASAVVYLFNLPEYAWVGAGTAIHLVLLVTSLK